MTKQDIQKYAVAAAAATAIASGAYVAGNRIQPCDYKLTYQGEEICIGAEVKEAIESGLKANSGFGGVRFGGAEQ